MLRLRYVDHVLAAEAGRLDQLVLLGAGYDSTALRHELPIRVFELDAPTTQRAKRDVIERRGLRLRTPVVWCPCDLELDSPAEVLGQAGFDPGGRTLTVWLGVSYYLTREAFRAGLHDVAAFTAPGGKLLWDYMDPEVIDGTTQWVGGRRAAEWVARRDEPYLLGLTLDDVRQELEDAGLALAEHLRVPELAARFGPPGGVWCSTDDWMGVVLAERR